MLTLKQKNRWSHRIPYLAAGAALSMTVLCHTLLHHPVAQRLSAINDRVTAARAELDTLKVQVHDLPAVERDVEQLKQMQASRHLPQYQNWGQFIREITSFGEANSLSKFTVQPGAPRKRDDLSQLPVAMTFEADYLSACGFLRRVEEMPRLSSMNGLTVHVVDSTVGRVQVQLSMNLYFADGF